MRKLIGARSRRSRSRKRQFGETKPNYGLEVKKEWEDFLKKEGPRIKEEDPEFYYHLISKKLPKKYRNPFRGTKLTPAEIIPVKIIEKTDDEIKRAKDDRLIKQQLVDMKEKQRKEYNRITFEKQQKLVHWCNAHNQGNWRSIHSEEYKSKKDKKYEYY